MYDVSKCCKALPCFNMKYISAQNKTMVFKCWACYPAVQLQTLATRCFPHHWSVRIEGTIHHQTDTSWAELWYFSSLMSLNWRMCFRQICLRPLRVFLLCNHVGLMTLIRPNQSGTRDELLYDLLWDAALLSMSRVCCGAVCFYGPFELRCFYNSHWWSAWDCAHIVMLSFSSTVLWCITFSRYYRPSLVILVYYTS